MEVRKTVLSMILVFFGKSFSDVPNSNETTAATWNCNSTKGIPPNIYHLIINCNARNQIPYSNYLFKYGNTTLDNLQKLTLNIGSNFTKLNSTHFANLNVEHLAVNYIYANKTGNESLLEINSDIVYKLDKVKSLEFSNVVFYNEKVIGGSTTEPTCTIEKLNMTRSNPRYVPYGWLAPCKKLKHLIITKMRQRNGTKEVRRNILSGLKHLKELEIRGCYIEELNDELDGLDNLIRLDVSHNQIHYALTTIVLPSLRELDLSHNHMFSSALFAAGVVKQPNLRSVSLDYNTVLDICDNLGYRLTVDDEPTWAEPVQGQDIHLPSIQRFSLRGTITTNMCFGNMVMDSLEYFDLSDSKISAFHFGALPTTKRGRLEVNVSGCPIKDIPGESFTETHYNDLKQTLLITGLNLTLDCECSGYLYLWRAVRERRVILDTALCANGLAISQLMESALHCHKTERGPCLSTTYWENNATDMTCNGTLRAIPHEVGLRKLYAAANQVENVTAEDIPPTLIYLDLSKNHIARMSEDTVNRLFQNKDMQIRLLGNPLVCDCDNKPMIQGLMDHYTQVLDYPYLTCIDDKRYIKDVVPADLCFTTSRTFTTGLVTAAGAIVGVLALLGALYYRYGQAIKVYLFSRGFCLFCIKEDELDADRPFDAFVSFSHKDEQFVNEHLLPGLEREPYSYKLCVHYRNWVAGDLIPIQINNSVDQSKKTIIVLSKNFIDSIWGLLEFRTAHLSALKDGRSRVIIIILEDLKDNELGGELRSYLRTNTYVKWGDPYFWDKLRFALPHRSNLNETPTLMVNNEATYLNSGSTDSAIEMDRFGSE